MAEISDIMLQKKGIWQAVLMTIPLDVGLVDTITPVKIPFTDTLTIAKGTGGFVDVIAHRFIVEVVGTYRVNAGGSFEFTNSAELLLGFYKNGFSMGQLIPIQGRGAGKPVRASNAGVMDLVPGDFLEGFALAETGSFNLVMTAGVFTAERLFI